ncbi:uncharacterized protein LOC111047210 isoform X2 [Nilaparvata lugens]|uniref:uncharacterized protein LOC111047210 isoform X2 n=1 Tax=Nilaparvata lugens TaxID=108931 RepID=UPI00193E2643|nr:uncharacterized protein LOC111047210 isoform X2 [Nilaparvata lugens]
MMKRSIGFGSYDAYPKTIIAQNDVYNKMSHHYRRLYSAKPCIDTGLKKQRNSSKDRKLLDWNSCRNRNSNSSQTKLKCCPNQKDSTKYNYTRVSHKFCSL